MNRHVRFFATTALIGTIADLYYLFLSVKLKMLPLESHAAPSNLSVKSWGNVKPLTAPHLFL